jgi:SAM-dependent methyltransferase
MRRFIRSYLTSIRRWVINSRLPEAGYPPCPFPTPVLAALSRDELRVINRLFDWHCFSTDDQGRRIGGVGGGSKRTEPQNLADPRVTDLAQRFPLAGRTVLEIGCFEGIHTIALAGAGADVLAIDARADNVAKTLIRCGLYGIRPRVAVIDIDAASLPCELLATDVCHHVGVLYHLHDPIGHLAALAPAIGQALMLDTHVATPEDATERYHSHGRDWPYRRYAEQGRKDPFSGTKDHAKWLLLDDLLSHLRILGFAEIDVVEHRDERNGARVRLFAARNVR